MSEHESPEAFESHRRSSSPAPDGDRPDWLVGAEEGAQAERGHDDAPAPQLKLVRPAEGDAPAAGRPAKPGRPKAWKAAASSVPKLQRVEGAGAAKPSPAAGSEPAWAQPALAGEPGARDAQPFDDFPAAAGADALADTDDALAVPRGPMAPASGPRLEEPWWAVAVDALRTHRPLQLGLLAALLAVLAWFMWPRSQPTVPIRSIHEHPERFDGMTVRVQGRVGDVYEIGGAHAFYLEQGRDTIVVFSRVRKPSRNERLQVSGSVSMGYLDGIARPSLFEIPD